MSWRVRCEDREGRTWTFDCETEEAARGVAAAQERAFSGQLRTDVFLGTSEEEIAQMARAIGDARERAAPSSAAPEEIFDTQMGITPEVRRRFRNLLSTTLNARSAYPLLDAMGTNALYGKHGVIRPKKTFVSFDFPSIPPGVFSTVKIQLDAFFHGIRLAVADPEDLFLSSLVAKKEIVVPRANHAVSCRHFPVLPEEDDLGRLAPFFALDMPVLCPDEVISLTLENRSSATRSASVLLWGVEIRDGDDGDADAT